MTRNEGFNGKQAAKDALDQMAPHLNRLQRWMLQLLRSVWLGFVRFPEQTVDDIDALLQRDSRREVVGSVQKSWKNKEQLPKHHRRIVLNALAWILLLTWMISMLIMLSVNVALAQQFQTAYVLAGYSFATSIFLPTPYELILESSAAEIGVVIAIAVAAVAKTIGTILVFSLGPSANRALNVVLQRYDTASKAFHWLEEQVRRPWGLAVIFGLLAIPLGSDTLVVYLLAPLNVSRLVVAPVALAAFALRSGLWLAVF